MVLNRVALAGLSLAAAGCMTVRSVPPAEYIPQHSPAMVWVTYTDNSFVPVAQPRIVGDTLKGTWAGLQEPVSVPLSEIKTVQAKLPSPKRTVMLVTVVALAAGGVAYTIATAGNSGDPDFLGCPRVKGTPLPDCIQD
jgi:hypothetical protein